MKGVIFSGDKARHIPKNDNNKCGKIKKSNTHAIEKAHSTKARTDKRRTHKKEARRLKARLKGLDKNKLDTAAPLIINAARLTVAIDDIWSDYLADGGGYVEIYDNGGGQKGRKASEARRAINEMTKHHTTIMRILIDLAPPAPPKRDEFDDFLDS